MDRRSLLAGVGLVGTGGIAGALVTRGNVSTDAVGDAVANATGSGEEPTPYREIDARGPVDSYRWVDLDEPTPTPGEYYAGESADVGALAVTIPKAADYDGIALSHKSWSDNPEDWQWNTNVPDAGGEVPVPILEVLKQSDYRPFPSRKFELISWFGGAGFVTEVGESVGIRVPEEVVRPDVFEG